MLLCYNSAMKLLQQSHQELSRKLNDYLNKDELFQRVYKYTNSRFSAAKNLTAHNWEHIYRDVLNSIVIGEAERANMTVVLPATTMHDIGFLYGATGRTHGAVGADRLKEFLSQGGILYAPEIVSEIASCIRTHKGSMHDEQPETLEAKVVADSDLLEKFGPFGIYSGLRTYGEFGLSIKEVLAREDQVNTLTLETSTGQKLAEPGRKFVTNFYRELNEAAFPYL